VIRQREPLHKLLPELVIIPFHWCLPEICSSQSHIDRQRARVLPKGLRFTLQTASEW